MSVYKPKNAKFFQYDFWRGGVRFYGSTGQTEEREARKVERVEIKKAETLAKGAKKSKDGPMTMNAAAGRYYLEIGQHAATAREIMNNLDRLVSWVGPDSPITEITDDTLSRLVARRRGERRRNTAREQGAGGRKKKPLGLISAAQVNRSVTQLLRRVLTRARKVWKVPLPDEPNWTAHILSEPKERVRELTHDEEERLDASERDDYHAPRMFAQITGVRRREVANLTWRQVDWEAGVIRVVGKGDKPHALPITPELSALLRPLMGRHETAVFTYLAQRTRTCPKSKRRFVKGQIYPATYEGLATHIGRALKKAGIDGFRLHDLRHTAASRFQRANGDLRLTQALLNHSSPKMTVRYAHATMDDLRDGMMRTTSDSTSRRTKSRNKSRDSA